MGEAHLGPPRCEATALALLSENPLDTLSLDIPGLALSANVSLERVQGGCAVALDGPSLTGLMPKVFEILFAFGLTRAMTAASMAGASFIVHVCRATGKGNKCMRSVPMRK